MAGGPTFVKAYIDAFAGSGHILARKQRRAPASLEPEAEAARDEHAFLEGSAQRALAVEPRFDRYIFIEKKGRHRASLERVRREAGELASRIEIRGGDANEVIRGLCSRNWRSRRALFTKVADHPRVLVGPTGTPLYLLCFAAGNPRGAALAVKLARHLLEDRRD